MAVRWTCASSAPMRSSQGQRSSSVSGWPDFILARAASVCRSSPSMNCAPSASASIWPTVVLPDPETPMTINASPPEVGGGAVDIEDVAMARTRLPRQRQLRRERLILYGTEDELKVEISGRKPSRREGVVDGRPGNVRRWALGRGRVSQYISTER